MAELLLYDWGPSPFCLKIRALLDWKGVPFRRRRVGLAEIFGLRRRGTTGKVPALELDGTLISDSTEIALAVDERWPEPPAVPRDGRKRAECMALEDWADEWLYWLGIYYQWQDPAGRRRVPAAFGRSVSGRATALVYARLIQQQLRGQGLGRKTEPQVRRDLERALDTVTGLLEPGPWLLGDGPYLCDFAVASQVLYVSRTPVGGPAVAARPRLAAYLEAMKTARGKPAA